MEDEPIVGRAYARMFGTAGFDVRWCENTNSVDEALTDPFDAFVIDLHLLQGDGMSVVRRVRAELPWAAVIVVSGALTYPVVYELGWLQVPFLEKPAKSDVVIRAVVNQLEELGRLRAKHESPLVAEHARYMHIRLSSALAHAGSVRRLATLLHIDRAYLQRLLKRYSVKKPGEED